MGVGEADFWGVQVTVGGCGWQNGEWGIQAVMRDQSWVKGKLSGGNEAEELLKQV